MVGIPDEPHSLGRTPRDQALRRLVEQDTISTPQALAVREALAAAESHPTRIRWAEVVGYIGGALFLVGALLLVTVSWDGLALTGQVLLLATVTFILLATSVIVAGGPKAMTGRTHQVSTMRGRITGMLLALGAVTSALTVHLRTAQDDLFSFLFFFSLDQTTLAAAGTGLAVAVVGYRALPTAVGAVTCWLMSLLLTGAVIGAVAPDPSGEATHTAMLVTVGLLWLILAAVGALVHLRLGQGLGAATALLGAQLSPEEAGVYLLSTLLAALLLGYYLWKPTAALLVFGILAIVSVAPRIVLDITTGEASAAVTLFITGAILLLTSWGGTRLHRRRTHSE